MIKVTLRKKKLKNNKDSLYLDFYPPIMLVDGTSTRREFLKLYAHSKPKSEAQRKHNNEVLELAELIRSKRSIDIASGEYKIKRHRGKQDFLKFFADTVQVKKETTSKANYQLWKLVYDHLTKCSNDHISFSSIDNFAESFKGYLRKLKLKNNTQALYFSKFKAGLILASRKRLIDRSVIDSIDRIKFVETEKVFLTFDEIQKLSITDFQYEDLKNASLFASLTGLRFIDISNLIWDKVVKYSDGYALNITTQKTLSVELLPITDEARELLGKRQNGNEKVFPKLRRWQTRFLNRWTKKAGISKEITFHSFRHSAATQLLNSGADLHTVQKILGHKDAKSTLVYAKLLNKTKRKAVNKLTLKK